ncbi:CocE/NonD family hydrolase [Nocardia fluminea]|uniref:CocE/NonD family hydrolase n=1 Tax=Nocardia fluminea TaxID=134984 RepID=UPI001FE2F7E3|nr:CocE/NonD family hydrolase [Nocardia fluminea]
MRLGGVVARAVAGVALVLGMVAPATAEPVTVAYTWTQEYFTAPDGTRLHADVLRPPGVAADARTPVLLTASPYRAHLAYLSQPRPGGGPSTDNLPVEWALRAGYTYVIVDLRGFGGSNGCPDFGGPGERSDVAAAVEWAASRPWSTGRVGVVGTSYEGWTGMMALAAKPKGLAAVAAFEPVVDPYSYLYMQGTAWKFGGKPLTEDGIRPADTAGAEHLAIASTPAHPDDGDEYKANALQMTQDCASRYLALTTDHNGANPDWRERDMVEAVRGNTTPMFLGQSFLDSNTRADRIIEAWEGRGPGEHRAWFGQWGHSDCREKCGTPHFASELYAFLNKHVAGAAVEVPGPPVTVGQFDGGWRGETVWPPTDARRVSVALRTGTFSDRGLLPGADREIWSISAPVTEPVHLAGRATATLALTGPPEATVALELYDIAPDGRATVITRGIAPVRAESGIRLLWQDARLATGHRLGVRITNAVDDVWSHTPTDATVTVASARLDLPLLTTPRELDLPGGVPIWHARWRTEETITLQPHMLNDPALRIELTAPTG